VSGEDALLWLDRYLFRLTPRSPDGRDVSKRFGAGSPTYLLTLGALRQWWDTVKNEPPVALKYEIWQKQLTVVYGEGVGTEDLFLQHTYLATLAKLLASVIFRQPALADEGEILTGAYFIGLGIQNFIEEDLFSWMLRAETKQAAVRLLRDLRTQLSQYDAAGFTEDVLKGLYQELVDPEVRRDLGEFYTPDWLAEYMLRETLADEPTRRVLDPACGSGTFLFLGVRLVTQGLKERGWSTERILEHLGGNVLGVDVHPLAVLVARTNYLIACAPLLAPRKRDFKVPVYLGDSLMYRSVVGTMAVRDVDVPADGETLWFPEALRHSPDLFDDVVANLVYAAERRDQLTFEGYLDRASLGADERRMLTDTFAALVRLFEVQRDSIWRFVIRNLIRPYILSKGEPFHVVIGNPPWLSLRYIKSPDYQKFVKDQMAALSIKPKGAKLVTQLELAALFFAECARNYLGQGGTIAFVMPRSVLIHRQHEEFMRFRFGPFGVRCDRILDLGDVSPLFSVPACALIGTKSGLTVPPVPRTVFRGRLPRKNASWEEARKLLEMTEDTWSPAKKAPAGPRYYLTRFRQGATIVPRRLWFVRLVSDPMLGFDPAAPLVETDATLPAKKPWKEIEMSGQVEAQALYASVLSTDILPFHCLRLRPVVLPLALEGDRPVLLSSADAFRRGLRHLGGWLERAEAEWTALKTPKAPAALNDWVDYLGKLTAQFPPRGRYVVVYCSAARETAGAIIDTADGLQTVVDGLAFSLCGLAVEHQVYWYATDNRTEALYVAGWVNSQAVDEAVRPRAMWGRYRERHIEKRIVEIGPPQFSASDAAHAEMAALAEQAAQAVAALAPSVRIRSLGSARRTVRRHRAIAPLLTRIDELARQIGGF
jgi:SAM-dependent methyltransferase